MGVFAGEFYSESLRMTTQLKVIFPDHSNDVTPVISGEPSVLYLLHGLAGNAAEWTRFSKIEYYAKKYNLIVVMPEVQRSFYMDTAYGPKYFNYVSEELPDICNAWFKLPREREKTFVAGESMGGYGAFKCALRCPERFGAAASLSGVLDFAHTARDILQESWADVEPCELRALLGEEGVVKAQDDLLKLVKREAKDEKRPRLFQICGTEDFLYTHNLTFRDAALAAGYGPAYMEGPGDHEWPFWDKAIQYAIQFFYGLNHERTPIY